MPPNEIDLDVRRKRERELASEISTSDLPVERLQWISINGSPNSWAAAAAAADAAADR